VEERGPVAISALTTLRVGGPCRRVLMPADETEIVEAVTRCDTEDEPVLLVGGGSNLVVADEGFPGTVVLVGSRGISVRTADESSVHVEVAAGEPWDGVVQRAVAEGWAGVEALSGIPGLTGATPVQNVGAYGQEVADTLVGVRVLDRQVAAVVDLSAAECGFAYRSSRLKGVDRWVVLSASFRLQRSTVSAPVAYGELARALGCQLGTRVAPADVRAAVVDLRRTKGMVLDPSDPDTTSVGSFFTNPVLSQADADLLPDAAPRYEQPDGRVKTSAAWLIEHAGLARGYGRGDARISAKHTLALTNRGSATTDEILDLAREIRDRVREAFGVDLTAEPRLVGVTL
jgi:UDP-N-acetylmuramate dehydrogenase